jgi:DNA-binding transcriptional LysR family regulator
MIARHHTLTGAARALGVQQPTMGRRLEALEQRAGTRLLQKTPSGYVLTDAGEAVLGNVERIEQEALSVGRRIAGADIRLEGEVRLTTIETLAAEVLSPILAAFRIIHPDVRIEIVASPRSLSLTKREADVALRLAPFPQQDLVVRKVGVVASGLYAAPSYLERHGMPDWAQGAAGHTLIMTEADLLDTPEMRFLRGAASAATVALTSNSRLVHRAAARDGVGIACLARYLGDGAADLVRVPPPGPAPARDLWMGVHADLRRMPRVRAFTQALTQGLRDAAGRLAPET